MERQAKCDAIASLNARHPFGRCHSVSARYPHGIHSISFRKALFMFTGKETISKRSTSVGEMFYRKIQILVSLFLKRRNQVTFGVSLFSRAPGFTAHLFITSTIGEHRRALPIKSHLLNIETFVRREGEQNFKTKHHQIHCPLPVLLIYKQIDKNEK